MAARDFCIEQTIRRLQQRFRAIVQRLTDHTQGLQSGQDVATTIADLRNLFIAIERLFATYPRPAYLSDEQSLILVCTLVQVLHWIGGHDRDIFDGSQSTQPQYASRGSHNPYQNFLLPQSQPGRFVEAIASVPVELLRDEETYLESFRNFCAQVRRDGADQNWMRQLLQVYNSKSAESGIYV